MPHTCYTVFINHVGALPESEPVTLFRLTDVKEYLRSPSRARLLLPHMQQNADDTWSTMLTDGLHSVRGLVDESGALIEAADYDPYGVPDTALTGTDFAFTGEMRDANGQCNARRAIHNTTVPATTRRAWVCSHRLIRLRGL